MITEKETDVIYVGEELRRLYPNSYIEFTGSSALLLNRILFQFKKNIDLFFYLLLSLSGILLVAIRFLESMYLRREIGLLYAIGWYPKNIVMFYVMNLIFVGLIGGVGASLSSLIFGQLIRGYFLASGDVPASGVSRAYLYTILSTVASGIPDYRLLILGPLIGIAISVLAGVIFILYLVRSSPDKILRGV